MTVINNDVAKREEANTMKKYIFSTITIICLIISIFCGKVYARDIDVPTPVKIELSPIEPSTPVHEIVNNSIASVRWIIIGWIAITIVLVGISIFITYQIMKNKNKKHL